MEPWPFSHGYMPNLSVEERAIFTLQWSHGPLAMDTAHGQHGIKSRRPFNGAMAL